MKRLTWLLLVAASSLSAGVLFSQWGEAEQSGLSPRESQRLLYQFRKAQAGERRVLLSRQRTQFKEFRTAQDLRFKEWNQRENAARREYFQNHPGPEKRAYMRDLKSRRHAFEKLLKEERTQRAKENAVRKQAIEASQRDNLNRFREFLQRGETPPRELWPTP